MGGGTMNYNITYVDYAALPSRMEAVGPSCPKTATFDPAVACAVPVIEFLAGCPAGLTHRPALPLRGPLLLAGAERGRPPSATRSTRRSPTCAQQDPATCGVAAAARRRHPQRVRVLAATSTASRRTAAPRLDHVPPGRQQVVRRAQPRDARAAHEHRRDASTTRPPRTTRTRSGSTTRARGSTRSRTTTTRRAPGRAGSARARRTGSTSRSARRGEGARAPQEPGFQGALARPVWESGPPAAPS